MRNSHTKLRKFRKIFYLLGIEIKSLLSLDVITRWNSNYIILKTVCLCEKTFKKYEETKTSFKANLGDDILNFVDWQYVSQMVDMLKIFCDIILRIYCSQYVIANAFLNKFLF